MAHAALINDIGHQLFDSITGSSKDENSNNSTARDRILQGLKDHRASRTNQFEVSAKYAGLIEKFEIFNRDDLATALQSRLSRLEERSGQSKWTPELLSFLLQLSDRPLEKTKLEDLERQAEANDVSSNAWKQILAEGAEDDPGLWDDIERGYHSSGDEGQAEESDSEHTTSTQATSVREDSIEAIARSNLILPDTEGVDAIRETHNGSPSNSRIRTLSELEIIRETLSMLQGLPTQLYISDPKSSRLGLVRDVSITTASSAVLNHLLRQCTIFGTSVNALRSWISSRKLVAYLRACQASIQLHIKHFNLQVAGIEQKYCAASHEALVVSIIAARSRIEELAAPLLSLSSLLRKATNPKTADSFALLDELYNEICITQITGNGASLSVLVDVFGAGLKAYLRTVGTWIRKGILDDRDQTFFVEHRNASGAAGSLWHEHFALRIAAHDQVHAPAFMQSFAHRIFALGKSRAFLQALDPGNERSDTLRPFDLPALDSDTLTPFSQILAQALTIWIDATSSDCTHTLRTKVLHDFGLLRVQCELERVFCSSDSAALQNFADALFWQMDHDAERWQNSFLLSELAMSTLLADSAGSSASLGVSFEPNSSATSAKPILSPIRALSTLKLNYTYTWALQNVTKSETAESHGKVLVFLLQIYRAQSALRECFISHRHFQSGSSTNTLNAALQTAIKLRHDLLWLADLLYAHITQTASVLGRAARQGLEEAADIDAMAETWANYERQLESSTIVAKNLSPIREAIIGILEMSLRWAREWDRLVDDYRQQSSSTRRTKDEDEEESPGQGDNVADAPSRTQRSAQESMAKMQSNFDVNLSFTTAGLRGIARAGGDPAVEALAERLGWRTR